MNRLFSDLRFSLRSLFRQPLLTIVAVATLALGIGANSAIFSVIDAVLLEPLPYESPERLVTLWQDMTRNEGPIDEWTSWDNFDDWRKRSSSFEAVTAISGWRPVLSGSDGEPPEQLRGGLTTYDVFETLGVEPTVGAAYRASDDLPNSEDVALISWAVFENRYGSDETIVGRSVDFNSGPLRILGVLPPGFSLPFVGEVDIMAPLGLDESTSCGRDCINLRVVARLAEGTTVEQAEQEMAILAAALEQEYPAENAGVASNVIPLHERVTGNVRTPLMVLLAAVGLVLLIACANVASVQLARTLGRREEFSVRLALGAGRGQLVQQIMIESLVLALLGGVVGLFVALAGLSLLRSAASGVFNDMVPRLALIEVDARTLLFTLAATVLTGVVFGILPGVRASGFQLRRGIQEGASSAAARRSRSALVVAEVALAVVLLIGAGLLGRSLLTLFSMDLGFDSQNTMVARVSLSTETYREAANRLAFTDRVLERMRAIEGVESVALTTSPPLAGNDGDLNLQIEGRADAEPGREPVAWLRVVDGDFFRGLGVDVKEGRAFASSDRLGGADVVLLNETAARRHFPQGDAVGQRVNFNGTPRWREVVGVVADTRHFGLTEPARPALYLPWQQSQFGAPYFLIKTSSDRPLEKADALRAAVLEADPSLAVAGVMTLDELVGNASATERLLVGLLGLFACVALLLAAIGLYGVISYSVLQRRRELGIRAALGASPGGLRGLVLKQGVLLALLGAVLGLGLSLFTSRLLESLLYEVSAFDPLIWSAVPLALLLIAALASWLPAMRASRVDVVTSLRAD